jgi:hypothetical protein
MAEPKVFLSNDAIGITEEEITVVANVSGNLTAATASPLFYCPVAGKIKSVWVGAGTYPATTDRTLTVTFLKNATALCGTDAAWASTAGSTRLGQNTISGGTGITAPVLKTDGTAIVAAGDYINYTVAIAGSNGTLGTGLHVGIKYVPNAA